MPTYATAAQVQLYVDATGLTTANIESLIDDAEAHIAVLLDGATLGSTAYGYVAALQTAVAIAQRDPQRVRTGQYDGDYGSRVSEWRSIIAETLRYAKMTSLKG